jgi:hypothetical protein
MNKAKSPIFLQKKPVWTETGSAADLKIRFLELQLLRKKVRIAQCGRIARTLDGTNREVRLSQAEATKSGPSADESV